MFDEINETTKRIVNKIAISAKIDQEISKFLSLASRCKNITPSDYNKIKFTLVKPMNLNAEEAEKEYKRILQKIADLKKKHNL